jgi:hypothetical protein
VRRLPPELREQVALRFGGGLTYAEISFANALVGRLADRDQFRPRFAAWQAVDFGERHEPALAVATTRCVVAQVQDDSVQPGAESRTETERWQRTVQPNERLVCKLRGQRGILNVHPRGAIDAVLVMLHQARERRFVAVRGPRDQVVF